MIPQKIIEITCSAYLIVSTLFLAGKDADSYLLKDRQDNPMTSKRVRRWHSDGLAMAFLFLVPCLFLGTWYWSAISALLVRLSIFDLFFNEWASLPSTYLGGTAFADKLFVKIFGVNGAIRKSACFFILFIGEQILIWIL